MLIRRFRPGFIALVLGCSLAVVACGDDDTSGSTTTVDGSDGTSATTEASDDTAPDGTESDTGDSGDASAFFGDADCEELSRAFDQGELSQSLASGTDPSESLRQTAEFLAAATDEAPDEIADDVAVLAETYADLADASEGVDWDAVQSGNPAALAEAAELGQVYADNPDFIPATQSLTTFISENCTAG